MNADILSQFGTHDPNVVVVSEDEESENANGEDKVLAKIYNERPTFLFIPHRSDI